MRKTLRILGLTLLLGTAAASASYGAVWRTGTGENENRWWYDYQDGTYACGGWQWIDGNGDGISQCYYFDENGWMAADTTTPDGYEVDADGAWIENGQVMTKEEQQERRILIENAGRQLTFLLNDSQAAAELYEQLPISIDVENFGSNEKIFYPYRELDTTGAPRASGGAGVLAYYEPWGDVVMFYGSFNPSAGLYQLGQIEAGREWIGTLSGRLEISRAD